MKCHNKWSEEQVCELQVEVLKGVMCIVQRQLIVAAVGFYFGNWSVVRDSVPVTIFLAQVIQPQLSKLLCVFRMLFLFKID